MSLTMLLAGAELFVRGGGRVALALKVPPEVVAMTFVAIGTALPEVLVAATAALRDAPALALGSVIGSHVAGLTLVLGLAAVRHPLRADARLLRRELPAVVILQITTGVLALDGTLGAFDGLVLLAIGAGYAAALVHDARTIGATGRPFHPTRRLDPVVGAGFLALGAVLALFGAGLLVQAATTWSQTNGSARIIALTLVPLVTTSPEIVAAVAGAWEDEVELALPHALGASVVTWSVALGVTLVLHPIAIAPSTAYEDLAVALAATLLPVPMMLAGPRLSRADGLVLVGVWLAWAAWLLGVP